MNKYCLYIAISITILYFCIYYTLHMSHQLEKEYIKNIAQKCFRKIIMDAKIQYLLWTLQQIMWVFLYDVKASKTLEYNCSCVFHVLKIWGFLERLFWITQVLNQMHEKCLMYNNIEIFNNISLISLLHTSLAAIVTKAANINVI